MDDTIKETLITNVEAKEILKDRKKEIELGYEQKNTYEYLKKYDNLDLKKIKEMSDKLKEIKKLRERQIIAIINIMPDDKDDLRLILEKDYNLLTEEEKNNILDIVKKFL